MTERSGGPYRAKRGRGTTQTEKARTNIEAAHRLRRSIVEMRMMGSQELHDKEHKLSFGDLQALLVGKLPCQRTDLGVLSKYLDQLDLVLEQGVQEAWEIAGSSERLHERKNTLLYYIMYC